MTDRDIKDVDFRVGKGKIINGAEMNYLLSNELKSIDPIHYGQVFEPISTMFFMGALSAIDGPFSFIDIGSNIGYYSVLCSSIRPDSTIYAFEPHPVVFDVLKKNSEIYQNIKPHCCGISDKNEDNVILYCDNRNVGGHSYTNSVETWGDKKGFQPEIGMYKVNSELKTIDSFDIDFSKVQIVKIDVQGLESVILKNIYPLLKKDTIILIEHEKEIMQFVEEKQMQFLYHIGIEMGIKKIHD